MARFKLLITLAVLSLVSFTSYAQTASVCESFLFCKCYNDSHPSWLVVNCTMTEKEILIIKNGTIPSETTVLMISGGLGVEFLQHSFSYLSDLRHVAISSTGKAIFRKYSGHKLNALNYLMDFNDTKVVRFEENAFTNVRGPLTVSLQNCGDVTISKQALSWISKLSLKDINILNLSPGAFVLDWTSVNNDSHGPGMTIELENLKIPQIPENVFGSSAAAITMKNIEVQVIRSQAFTGIAFNVVKAINCTFNLIEGGAFAQKSLIDKLEFQGCSIDYISSGAMKSAVTIFDVVNCSIPKLDTGAINMTVAHFTIQGNTFKNLRRQSFVINTYNLLHIEGNSFDNLPAYAIDATGSHSYRLVFKLNELESAESSSLGFISNEKHLEQGDITYKSNYYGYSCECNMSEWLKRVLGGIQDLKNYMEETYCTVNEFLARCYNNPDQTMQASKFLDKVCTKNSTIACEPQIIKSAVEGAKAPRFPHHKETVESLSDRDKKIIGIVIVTAVGCVIIVLFISLIRWMRRRGYCHRVKNLFTCCNNACTRFCSCGYRDEQNISTAQYNANDFNERRLLNDPMIAQGPVFTEVPLATTETETEAEAEAPHEHKTTQTLPEELTKELLENLKERLEDPENYIEAREMIEHLYELIKVEEACNSNAPVLPANVDENIYELPFQNTAPRLGKNKKQMVSVGTEIPCLDQLTPLSPYNRRIALAHEYFEPKDLAIHLYAEIANSDKERNMLLNAMPDILAEQVKPRGPYLRAVCDKLYNSSASSSFTSPTKSFSPMNSPLLKPGESSSTSPTSETSAKMLNRPLPEKPV